jgi:hypothetical protein
MGTIFIIIAIIAIAVAVNFWRNRQKHVTEAPQGQPSNPNASVPGWELRSIPRGEHVVINGEKVDFCSLALVSGQQPKYNYNYTVDFDYEFITGKNTVCTSGVVDASKTFVANGETYFGIILAGAPGAKITEIREMIVK